MSIDPNEKHKSLTVKFEDIMGLNQKAQREVLKKPAFKDMLSQLSPAQRIELFPGYYRQTLDSEQQSILSGKSGGGIWSSLMGAADRANAGGFGAKTGTMIGGPSASVTIPKSEFDKVLEKTGMSKVRRDSMIRTQAAGQIPIEYGKKPILDVYNSAIRAGMSPIAAKAFTKHVGRENDFRSQYMFGTHAEMAAGAGNRPNTGIISWGDPARRKAFMSHMQGLGLMDERGNMPNSQEALDAQAAFAFDEMKNYKGSDAFRSGDVTEEEAMLFLDKYIGWDAAGRKHDAAKSKEKMASYGNELESYKKELGTTIEDTAMPTMEEKYARTVAVEQANAQLGSTLLQVGVEPGVVSAMQIEAVKASETGDWKQFYKLAEDNNVEKVVADNARETATQSGEFAKYVEEAQGTEAGKRNLRIDTHLRNIMGQAAAITDPNSNTRVTSGGQGELPDGTKSKGNTGTHEHNVHKGNTGGGAADFNYKITDPDTGKTRILDYRKVEDAAALEKLTEEFAAGGGRSAGFGYMTDKTKIHFGISRYGDPGVYAGPKYLKDAFDRGRARYLNELKERGLEDDAGRTLFAEKQKERAAREQQVANADSVKIEPSKTAGWDKIDSGMTPTPTATVAETPASTPVATTEAPTPAAPPEVPEEPTVVSQNYAGTGTSGIYVPEPSAIIPLSGDIAGKKIETIGERGPEKVTVENSVQANRANTAKDTGPLAREAPVPQPEEQPEQEQQASAQPSPVQMAMSNGRGQSEPGLRENMIPNPGSNMTGSVMNHYAETLWPLKNHSLTTDQIPIAGIA